MLVLKHDPYKYSIIDSLLKNIDANLGKEDKIESNYAKLNNLKRI